jgi:AraC-like DNA-binding protein
VDVLSDAITAMRTGRPHSTHYDLDPPWGMHFASSASGGFHVVLRGTCWLIPEPPQPPVALGPGDVVFVRGTTSHGLADSPSSPLAEFEPGPPDVPYRRAGNAGPGARTAVLCGAYQLDVTRAHPLLAAVPPIIHLPAQVGHHSALRATVDLLGSELDSPGPGSGAMVPALLDTLLISILRAWFAQESVHGATGWGAALRDQAIVAALTAIHERPAHPWTVAELGERAGLSRAAFARRFSALVGQPPLTYLTWWRITTAAHLLRRPDTPLRVVAERSGYASEIAFAAAFKREFGVTPAGYRRRNTA